MVATLLRSSLAVLPAPARPAARRAGRTLVTKLRATKLRVTKLRGVSLPKWERRSFDDMSLEEGCRLADVILRSGIR